MFLPLFNKSILHFNFSNNCLVCDCHDKLSFSQMPRNFVSWEFCILWFSNLICVASHFPLGLNSMKTVLSTFRVNLFVLNQSLIISRSCSRQHNTKFLFLWLKYSVVSSANCIHLRKDKFLCKSLQKIKKSKEPRQDPCGVPYSTSYHSEYLVPVVSLHFDLSFLLVR